MLTLRKLLIFGSHHWRTCPSTGTRTRLPGCTLLLLDMISVHTTQVLDTVVLSFESFFAYSFAALVWAVKELLAFVFGDLGSMH